MVKCEELLQKDYIKNGMASTWKKKRKVTKLLDTGSNRNEREKGINNIEWINGYECRRKIKLGTGRYEITDVLYIKSIKNFQK